MKLLAVTAALALLLSIPIAPALAEDGSAFSQMGKHMEMGPHMTMTTLRPATPADTQRAEQILATMRSALAQYQDYNAAETDGYEPYMESVPQDVYHFANRRQSAAEYLGDIDLAHPGSLLYEKKTFGGYKLVGAMYSAPPDFTLEQLDKIIPLSVAQWHAHTNICLPAGITEADVMNGRVMPPRPDISSVSGMDHGMSGGNGDALRRRVGYLADDRFGFLGTIADQANCEAAGGTFHKQIFGWMVHVYPFAGDDLKVNFGMQAP